MDLLSGKINHTVEADPVDGLQRELGLGTAVCLGIILGAILYPYLA